MKTNAKHSRKAGSLDIQVINAAWTMIDACLPIGLASRILAAANGHATEFTIYAGESGRALVEAYIPARLAPRIVEMARTSRIAVTVG